METGVFLEPGGEVRAQVAGVERAGQHDLVSVGGQRVEGLLELIAKCDVVCANCHRIRTARSHHAAMRISRLARNRGDGKAA